MPKATRKDIERTIDDLLNGNVTGIHIEGLTSEEERALLHKMTVVKPLPQQTALDLKRYPGQATVGKKFDDGKPAYNIVPALVRVELTPGGNACGNLGAHVLPMPDEMDDDAAKEFCLTKSLAKFYAGHHIFSLIWLCRYFMVKDSGYTGFENIQFPLLGLGRAVKVMEHGSVKYGKDNWQSLSDFVDRYSSAADRHLGPYLAGQEFDVDSGLEHLAHFQCNALFLAWQALGGKPNTVS